MLERLINTCDAYAKNHTVKFYSREIPNQYNPRVITKLLQNYRSHPALLYIPSKLFYENELACLGDRLCYLAEDWKELPNRIYPLVFHSVIGLDQQEDDSPSYFNVQEVTAVISYLEKLIGTEMKGVTISEKDIAVIAPYRKQVQKIQQACSKKNWGNVLVCTTEQIQGQEKLIVILSAVRSSPEMLEVDAKFKLGFIGNPKVVFLHYVFYFKILTFLWF